MTLAGKIHISDSTRTALDSNCSYPGFDVECRGQIEVKVTLIVSCPFISHNEGALKSRDLTSRDWTTRHQIKQIATG